MISITFFSFTTLKVSFHYCFSFIKLKIFFSQILPILIEVINLYGAVAIFACTCFLGMIVIALFIPETKGKNLIASETVSNKI